MTVYAMHRDRMAKGCVGLIERIKAMEPGADRGIALARLRKMVCESDKPNVDAFVERGAAALDRIDPNSTGIDIPCRFCQFPYLFQVWDAESAPVVARESGTWPSDYPDKLAGKHYHSRDEKMEQVRTLTPGLVLSETQQEIREKPKRPKRETAAPVPAPPPPTPDAEAAARISAWFQAHKGAQPVASCARDVGLETETVRDIVRADPHFKRWFGDNYEWKRPLPNTGTAHPS